jgi:hypothetical protein
MVKFFEFLNEFRRLLLPDALDSARGGDKDGGVGPADAGPTF